MHSTKRKFTARRCGNKLAFWLPEQLELKEIIARFDGMALESIASQPVRLDHIYVEVTRERAVLELGIAGEHKH